MIKFTIRIILLLILSFFISHTLVSQEQEEAIDLSKPTNIYTRLNNNFEYLNAEGFEFYGYRVNYNMALSKFQGTVELPLLYNTRTKNFGLDDVRLRAYYVPYTNYDKFFGGAGVSLDVFLPTGEFEKGLGTGAWSISPGFVFGMIFSDRYSLFPNISYRYQFKENPQVERHGATIQLTNSIVLSEKSFILLVPMFFQNDFSDKDSLDSGGEFEFNYMVKYNKLQLGFFTRQLFKSNSQTYRLFVRLFL